MIEENTTMPCKWCGQPTKFTGTQECDNCHEVYMRLGNSITDVTPKVLAKMTKSVWGKPRTCYDCHYYQVCALHLHAQDMIHTYVDRSSVDMPHPDWQRIHEAIANACLQWTKR